MAKGGDDKHRATRLVQVEAWGVHLLTASGAVIAGLAILAIAEGNPRRALIWLLLALVVDGIDGPIARKVSVAKVLPSIDGALLDLIVDYLTYVFVPVAFIYQFGLLPEGWVVPVSGLILLSSLYLFCNTNMKSQDLFFVGFPSIWNIAVMYAFVLETKPFLNLALATLLIVLTFVPIKTIHPFRVQRFRPVTAALAIGWMFTTMAVIATFPQRSLLLEALWIALAGYFIAISLWRTFQVSRETARG